MQIRNAVLSELDDVMALYDRGRAFMRACGNVKQWINGYPSRQLVTEDIEHGHCFVAEEEGRLLAVFAFIGGADSTYAVIDGAWKSDAPYHTIHRIAVGEQGRGLAQQIFAWCAAQDPNLRADTHEDNQPMQHALTKFGFEYCGIIHIDDGSPRLAYQYRG